MKTLLILLCCLAAALTGGRAAEATGETNVPLYRYLFVVDTSSAMSRQKDVAIDMVHRLILSGINGRVKTGDVLGIWTFNDKLHTDVFPPQMWVPQQRHDVANRAYRLLRDQKLTKKARTDEVVAAIRQAAGLAGTLTVFLCTDGTSAVKGTPFDDAINEIFRNHSAEMGKNKRPFVVVFVARDGELADHAVSPGGGPIYIPAVAKAAAPVGAQPSTNLPVAKTNAAIEPKPQPADPPRPSQSDAAPAKTLSFEEIAVEIAQQAAQKRSNTAAATSAPPATPPQSSAPKPENPAPPTPVAAIPPKTGIVDSASPTTSERKADAPLPTIAQTQQAPQNVLEPANKEVSPPPNVLARPSAPSAERTEETVAVAPSGPPNGPKPVTAVQTESPTASSSPQQTALVVPDGADSNPQIYLLIGVVVLFVAGVLGWLFFRNSPSTPQPSLISRSMDAEEKRR
ncbi:MAG TPA: hypothetical protein VJW76_04490 [Verrucomicrobiae bacterium]|nr:hypothetical protein [Verrucomicrobiae bacterium]